MSKNRELRYMPFENWEVREDANKQPRLVGYSSVFNVEAEIMGWWREKVSPGAFKKTIAENDIRALWNHNTDIVLGRNKAGTLTLSEDEKGLRAEIIPPDTQAGRDSVTSIKRGDVSQMSISFRIIKQEWLIPEDKKELPLRTIKEAKLYEVSPVTFPAFEQTSISARSKLEPESKDDPREEALRLSVSAEHGLELTNEQRETIRAALELYKPHLLEPETNNGHHSRQVGKPEPESGHHSTDWQEAAIERERLLVAIEQTL